ncbi:MAG: hypothetical protein WCX82_01905 [archaeon]|jgi:hypothetical protein
MKINTKILLISIFYFLFALYNLAMFVRLLLPDSGMGALLAPAFFFLFVIFLLIGVGILIKSNFARWCAIVISIISILTFSNINFDAFNSYSQIILLSNTLKSLNFGLNLLIAIINVLIVIFWFSKDSKNYFKKDKKQAK